jgi:hypothetical protein
MQPLTDGLNQWLGALLDEAGAEAEARVAGESE